MALRPNWVSVLIGINDVWRQFDSPYIPETHVPPEEFERTYETLIQRTLPAVRGMILMAPYFMEPNRTDPMRARMDEYGRIITRNYAELTELADGQLYLEKAKTKKKKRKTGSR